MHNEEHHDFYSSLKITQVIKGEEMRGEFGKYGEKEYRILVWKTEGNVFKII